MNKITFKQLPRIVRNKTAKYWRINLHRIKQKMNKAEPSIMLQVDRTEHKFTDSKYGRREENRNG